MVAAVDASIWREVDTERPQHLTLRQAPQRRIGRVERVGLPFAVSTAAMNPSPSRASAVSVPRSMAAPYFFAWLAMRARSSGPAMPSGKPAWLCDLGISAVQ